ncbi:MAG: hypothetical protein GXP42_08530 [Chloroflexi bacterium]|nr:hypothetical protein [Chloroflexota bacterium]
MIHGGWKKRAMIALSAAGLLAALLWTVALAETGGSVEGVVVDAGGPIAEARVRVRATENRTLTNAEGRFRLEGLEEGKKVEIAAWYEGYYIARAYVTPTVAGVTLTLRPYHTEDNPEYEWAPPTVCAECHPMIVSQWQNNAHGRAVANRRFFSMYNGTDVSGENRVAPGFVDDFPGVTGNCASCHAPGAGADGYLTTDMNAVREKAVTGIFCDFCHKVGGVYLNPATQAVYSNMPGAESQRLLRPPEGDNIFFGPYDDIHDPDTYLPIISDSRFCAPCHQFSFWGTPIYESYGEWLASPYATQGVMCQDCHMPPTDDDHFALPEKGGLSHPPETIPSHLQLGASSETLLQNTVSMTIAAAQTAGALRVTVTITNTGTGHHIPTDHPGRHMILTVSAKDEQGRVLPLLAGSRTPEWAGPEAGRPGKAFAKVLKDVASGEYPVVSYWKQALIQSDNRIPAMAADRSTYVFAGPTDATEITIEARLIFRRLFADLAEAKGWDAADMLMAREQTRLTVEPGARLYLPSVLGASTPP